jgi:phosphate transport system protein
MARAPEHIVKSFDEALNDMRALVTRMGGLAEAQIAAGVKALAQRDEDLARKVIAGDAAIDTLEDEIDDAAVRLIALRQPMAIDLREVIAALKISSDIERIADYAANVAKRSIALNQTPPVPSASAIPRLARLVQNILKDTLDAYAERDAERAIDVWHRDEEVDEMYTGLFRELLTYMMEDVRNITPCTHLLFIAKNIERMGDHATNIAENIHFLVTGKRLEGGRPKGDTTSFQVVAPPEDDGTQS